MSSAAHSEHLPGLSGPFLLERDAELALLSTRLIELRTDGRGGVIVIEGPPGIGKTSLLSALVGQDHQDVRVLQASGSELEGVLAFGAVRQLLGPAVFALDDLARERAFAGPAAVARPVLGISSGRQGALAEPLYGLYWLTVGLAELAPLLVVVDDAHWVDEESGRFLAYLAERLEGVPALVLVATWPDEQGHDGFLTGLRDRATILRPPPLSEAAVETMLGRPAGDALAVTGGIPLLVRELVHALKDAPDMPLDQIGPQAVARRMLDRVRRVSGAALALAEAVSLFADGAPLDVAGAIAGLAEDAAIDAADDLIAIGIFSNHARLRFEHPLMRRAIYDDLRPFARRRWHARAAAELRTIHAPVESIAAHLLAGVPRRDEEDMRILVTAADDAEARGALAAATRYLERALDEGVGSAADRASLRGRLGAMLAATGRPEAVPVLRQAVREAADLRTRADLAVQLGLVASGHGVGESDAVAVLRQIRDEPDLDADRRIALDGILAGILETRQDPEAAAVFARIPDDLPGDTPGERLALSNVAYRRYLLGDPAAHIRDLVLRSMPDSAVIDVGTDANDSSPLLMACGYLDEAEAIGTARLERARVSGSQTGYVAARMMLANVAAFRGDLVGAEADLRLCLEASPPVRVVAYLSSYLHNVLVHQGRADEAEALHGEIEGWVPIPLSQLEGVVAFARSEYQLAADSLLRARAEYVSRGVFSPARLRWTGKLADALAACGRLDEAWELIHEYRAAAERFGAVAPIADAHVLAGRHSPGPEGREHLEAAHALLEPSPHRLDAARATLELGARLRHDNERTAARELMMPALEYAEHQRVAPLVARLREELAMCGARPRKIVLRGVDALTPAESRIARLAADGLQNKEIAQQLFLTVGTVQTTLVRVYRKLDVSSRRELATAVGR